MYHSRFLHSLSLFILCCCLLSCRSEKHNDLGLEESELAYFLANGASNTYASKASLTKEEDSYKMSILAIHEEEGMIITVSNVEPFKPAKYPFYKDVSIVVHDRSRGNLTVFVSSGCKENKGVFEIVEWDNNNKTISGRFSGPVCTRSIFAHLPGTNIDDAAFFKIKYDEH